MSERLKRILLIVGFIVVVVVIGFVIWRVFFKPVFRPEIPVAPGLPVTPPSPGLPVAPPAPPRVTVPEVAPPAVAPEAAPSTVARGGITETSNLVNLPVLSPFLSPDGTNIQYYNRLDGKFYRVRPDGTIEVLTDKVFFNVSNIVWAPNRNRAVLEYPDGSNILYDFSTGRQVTLPRHWEQFSFSGDSQQIAFLAMGQDRDSRWLATSSAEGAQSRPIEPLGENADKVQVSWSPNDQVIAFSRTGLPQGLSSQEILFVGKEHENFKSLITNGIGFEGTWSPDGGQILYQVSSAESDWKPQLWIASGTPDSIGAGKTPLGLNTWVDKCTFGNTTTLYCAVPNELPRGVGLYPQAAGATRDQLWRVNLQTGQQERVAIPTGDYTIDRVVVTDDERYLYFTDQTSGQLFKINLK